MASPLPPVDTEQQNIIDKLAEFVARNGPEFEALTSEKQRDNPKFAFLRGGQFHEYYMYRVNEARKIWQQQYPTKNKPHQILNSRSNWVNMNEQWDQYGGNPDHWQRYSSAPPGHCGWGGPDPSWYPKPQWPPYQQGVRMHGGQPEYPYHPPSEAVDSYRHGNYNNHPPYGYPGHHGAFPIQQFSFGPETYRAPKPHYDYQVPGGSELGEADIEQSEKNLAAQHESLLARQNVEILELLDKKREENVRKTGEKLNMSWEQMNEMIQPLIEACTKENISKGKSWVVDKMSESAELTKLMSDYLITRASAIGVSFDLRLHLVYLLNDLLHHSKRRGAPVHLQEALHETVPVIFCLATEIADDEQRAKINRVLSLWETNSYLPVEVLVKMRPPESGKFLAEWKESQSKPFESEIDKIKTNIMNQYTSLERQHQEFADHVLRQLASSHSDKSDEASISDNHHSQYGSSHHPMQNVDPNFTYWGPPPQTTGGFDMLPQDMMSGSDPRDMQRRMPGYPPPSQMSGYTGPGGGGGGGGASYPPQMGWPPGQHDSAKWNQSVPNYNSQPGHKNFGGHELSSNVYIEGEEPDDEQSAYPNSSYECGSYGGYYNNNNNDYRQYEDSSHSVRNTRDNQSNRDEKPRTFRGSRPSRFSSTPSHPETGNEKKIDRSDTGKNTVTMEQQHITPKTDLEMPKNSENSMIPVVESYDINQKFPAWQLPAGLVHPLIRLKDFDFTPLNENNLQLLPPTTPSERLLMALENFYMPPTPDKPRDGEGWEHMALHEFYTKKERARPSDHKENDRDNTSTSKAKSNRRRQHSGGSYASSHSEYDFTNELVPDLQHDIVVDVEKPFSRDNSDKETPLGPSQLAYITSYPKIAVGQPLRTGLEALTLAPPPMQCMQGQLTHNYSAYKTAGIQPGIPIPVPPLPGLLGAIPPGPSGFPNTSFLQFPPPVNQPPPTLPLPQGLIQRPPPGFSVDRFESRGSRSRSRSDSRSKSHSHSADSRSRDFRSRSRSRSRSHSSQSRSQSRSDSRDSRSKSVSPNNDDETGSNQSRGLSRDRRRDRSRSRSSGSPFARFTSAPGPGGLGAAGGGTGGGNINAARAAAIAAAVSIANSINAQSGWSNNNNQGQHNRGGGVGGGGGSRGGYNPNNLSGRGGSNMRYHGSDDRFYPPPRDHQRR
ncbi:unnamed protein product [Schistosoma rodhaini]|uniref:SURP motif domain-containing protein n=2 Tax=Schistosoma rodhaini TaxID=6188 RepID=A0AA85F1J9_9TREM|nr:unnamed protein product [Schistosoma rodhaini]